jgi:hypothetical protein
MFEMMNEIFHIKQNPVMNSTKRIDKEMYIQLWVITEMNKKGEMIKCVQWMKDSHWVHI